VNNLTNKHRLTYLLQTAKFILQWISSKVGISSLQAAAQSCSKPCVFAIRNTYTSGTETARNPFIYKVFALGRYLTTPSLQTATAKLQYFLFSKAQLHTAITPTTPFRGVGVVAVQCCAVSVSVIFTSTFFTK